jgi:hypothetical protein
VGKQATGQGPQEVRSGARGMARARQQASYAQGGHNPSACREGAPDGTGYRLNMPETVRRGAHRAENRSGWRRGAPERVARPLPPLVRDCSEQRLQDRLGVAPTRISGLAYNAKSNSLFRRVVAGAVGTCSKSQRERKRSMHSPGPKRPPLRLFQEGVAFGCSARPNPTSQNHSPNERS